MLTAQSSTSYWPQEAQNLEQTGLSFSLVLDLILKSAYLEGTIMLGVRFTGGASIRNGALGMRGY